MSAHEMTTMDGDTSVMPRSVPEIVQLVQQENLAQLKEKGEVPVTDSKGNQGKLMLWKPTQKSQELLKQAPKTSIIQQNDDHPTICLFNTDFIRFCIRNPLLVLEEPFIADKIPTIHLLPMLARSKPPYNEGVMQVLAQRKDLRLMGDEYDIRILCSKSPVFCDAYFSQQRKNDTFADNFYILLAALSELKQKSGTDTTQFFLDMLKTRPVELLSESPGVSDRPSQANLHNLYNILSEGWIERSKIAEIFVEQDNLLFPLLCNLSTHENKKIAQKATDILNLVCASLSRDQVMEVVGSQLRKPGEYKSYLYQVQYRQGLGLRRPLTCIDRLSETQQGIEILARLALSSPKNALAYQLPPQTYFKVMLQLKPRELAQVSDSMYLQNSLKKSPPKKDKLVKVLSQGINAYGVNVDFLRPYLNQLDQKQFALLLNALSSTKDKLECLAAREAILKDLCAQYQGKFLGGLITRILGGLITRILGGLITRNFRAELKELEKARQALQPATPSSFKKLVVVSQASELKPGYPVVDLTMPAEVSKQASLHTDRAAKTTKQTPNPIMPKEIALPTHEEPAPAHTQASQTQKPNAQVSTPAPDIQCFSTATTMRNQMQKPQNATLSAPLFPAVPTHDPASGQDKKKSESEMQCPA